MLPKKRQSKTRSKKRRTHYTSSLVHTVTCKTLENNIYRIMHTIMMESCTIKENQSIRTNE
ncbi:MAG: 50S ribosomal protein L32 [Fidelibacterota bacterium]